MAIAKGSCYLYISEDGIGDILLSGIVFGVVVVFGAVVEEAFCYAWFMSVMTEKKVEHD